MNTIKPNAEPYDAPKPLPAKCCGRCEHWGKTHSRPDASVAYCSITGVIAAKEEGAMCFLFGLDIQEILPDYQYCGDCRFIFEADKLITCEVCGELVCEDCLSGAQATREGGAVCVPCYEYGRR